jgi:hypothetical protein
MTFESGKGDLRLSIWDINVIEPEASGHMMETELEVHSHSENNQRALQHDFGSSEPWVFGFSRQSPVRPGTCGTRQELLEMLAL